MTYKDILVIVLFQARIRSRSQAVSLQVLDSILKSVENRHFDIIICIANLD